MLTGAPHWGADQKRSRAPPQKILKAPLSAQLGIDETSSRHSTEGRQVEFRERARGNRPTKPSLQVIGRKTAGIRPAPPPAAADAAWGQGSFTTGARDEGQEKAVIGQFAEPSVEVEKNSPAGKTGRAHEIGGSVAVAPFDAAAVDPLTEASAALDDKDYATAQRLFAATGRKDVAEAIKDAMAALDRRDYAKAQGLFEALGQKAAAAAHVKGSAPASPPPPKPAALAGGPIGSISLNEARQKPATSSPEIIPVPDGAYRRPPPQAETAKSRRLRPLLLGTGLVLLTIFGVSAIYGSPLNWTFPTTKSQAIAGLSSAADVLKADLGAITGQSAREQDSATRDVSAALTARVDQIEHEYGARLDKLSEHVDQDSSSRFADLAARLDRLEKKSALPATPVSKSADVVARLDKLEKRVAAAAAPASEICRCRGEAR